MHAFYSRPISPDELRLVRGFRLLETMPDALPTDSKCITVVAPGYGASLSPNIKVPRALGITTSLPRYSADEIITTARMFVELGIIPEMPSASALLYAGTLLNGNAKEVREYGPALLTDQKPMGVSMGYKAEAVVRQMYDVLV